MVREGRVVPVSQLRSALLLIDTSRKTSMSKISLLKEEIKILQRFVEIGFRNP